MSINIAVLSGRIGRDPEHKQVGAKGTDLASTSLAVDVGWGDRESTDWYTLNFWGGRAALADHVSKGDKVVVVGEVEQDEYEDKSGQTRQDVKVSVTSIEFMSGGGGSSRGGSSGAAKRSQSSRQRKEPEDDFSNESLESSMNDDLPF